MIVLVQAPEGKKLWNTILNLDSQNVYSIIWISIYFSTYLQFAEDMFCYALMQAVWSLFLASRQLKTYDPAIGVVAMILAFIQVD